MMPNKKWQKNILHQLVQDKYSQLLIDRGVILFLNHDLELRSSSFPFGRIGASFILLSLNHDLFAILNVYSLWHLTI